MAEFARFIQLFLVLAVPVLAHAEGVKSLYTDRVQSLLSDEKPAPTDFYLKCWTNPQNDLYMGIEQRVKIKAPFKQVAAVVGNIDDYANLFPGFKKIQIASKIDENHFTVYFEQIVPLFFVPNVKYDMLYTVVDPSPTKKIFWYQLKEARTIKNSDGLIILKDNGDGSTDYTEFDFFDADWGPAKLAGKNKLWHDSVEGIYLSDLATQIKSENPKLSAEDARKEAKKTAKDSVVEACVKARIELK